MQKMLHTAEEKFLVQLAKEYPTVAAASSEIINLQAILRLPKPTEHFMSDLHGESDAFTHILGNEMCIRDSQPDILYHGAAKRPQQNRIHCGFAWFNVLKAMRDKRISARSRCV